MILTVTMNPSVDISYSLKRLEIDTVNRASGVTKAAGGKGLNVSRVIKLAGEEVLATGLIGGTPGEYILEHLDASGIRHNFLSVQGESRNCIAILHQGYQTEILEAGPAITADEQQQFFDKFSQLLNAASTIVISGSLPGGIAKDYYKKLIELAKDQDKKILLDCSGECLEKATDGRLIPWLIKPNQQELEQLTGKKLQVAAIESFIDIVNSHPRLQRIPWVVVSLGKDGAFARINSRFYRVTIPVVSVVNAVGSGDATIAGLAIGINRGEPPETILKRAMAFGILNAVEPLTGYINMENFSCIFNQITVSAVNNQ